VNQVPTLISRNRLFRNTYTQYSIVLQLTGALTLLSYYTYTNHDNIARLQNVRQM